MLAGSCIWSHSPAIVEALVVEVVVGVPRVYAPAVFDTVYHAPDDHDVLASASNALKVVLELPSSEAVTV
jgi:hypothetical protein